MTSTLVMNTGTVAIVGGGCSGVLTARALLRNTTWRTVLISPDDRPGCGVAYGAAQPWHVLNSRAAAMSVDSADPHHLVHWCRGRGLPVEPTDFLPRSLYGDYLADQFAATAAAAGPRSQRHTATAATIQRTGAGFAVTDDSGATVHADQVVLTVGNPPPRRPAGVSDEAYRDPAFVADPWAPGALDAIPDGAPVLLLGTGLTAVDVALSLTTGGRRAAVEALSRRGLLPLAHPALPAPAVLPTFPPQPSTTTRPASAAVPAPSGRPASGAVPAPSGRPASAAVPAPSGRPASAAVPAPSGRPASAAVPAPAAALGLPAGPQLAPLLRRLRQAVAAGIDWTALIDLVRTDADRLWTGLDEAAQQRFLRHCLRFWEVHRHRMAPPVAERVADLRRTGLLKVRAGRVESITPHPGGGLVVAVAGEEPRWYGAVITCTGPGPLPAAAGPLLAGMLDDGLLAPGPHGLGIDADADGRVLGAGGRVQPGLWLVGPLRRGRVWEATAVPEIRRQVDRLVEALPAPAGLPGETLG